MDERQWDHYLCMLAQQGNATPRACVGCWYEQQAPGQPFPGDSVSSTLCPRHLLRLPREVKAPDGLLPTRPCAV